MEDLELKREQKEQLKMMTDIEGTLAKSISEGFLALTSCLNKQNPFPIHLNQGNSMATGSVNQQNHPY